MVTKGKTLEVDIAATFGSTVSRTNRFAIYIPSADKDSKPISDQEAWTQKALKLLTKINGGATAMPPIRGAWFNEGTKEIVIEEPVIVYSFVDPEKFEAHLQEVVKFVDSLAKKTNQGQMAIEFNQEMMLIDYPKAKAKAKGK
jgi:hypothetical protein